MFKKVLISLVVLAGGAILSVIYFDNLTSILGSRLNSNVNLEAFEKAKTLYFKNQLATSLQTLEQANLIGKEETIESGCELVLSIYSEQKRLDKIPELAKRCTNTGKAVPLAFDALAMSLTEQKKFDQAIMELQSGLKNLPIGQDRSRIELTLAHTYLLSGKIQLAKATALHAFENLKIWEPWASRWVQLKPIQSEKDFFTHLSEIALNRNASEAFRKKLQEKLKKLDLLETAAKLQSAPNKGTKKL